MDVTVNQEAEGKSFSFLPESEILTSELKAFKFDSINQTIITETKEFSAVCPFSGLPDIAYIKIEYKPKARLCVELKSLKYYLQQFRDKIISYERLINVVFDDLMGAYEPDRLRIVMVFNPRGGISSKLTIDSDWKARGGEEKYKDWVGLGEEW